MRSAGFSFYFGGLGVETCSLDAAFAPASVRNRSQPFASVRTSVRERPSWGQHGRAAGEFCKSGHFCKYQRSRSLVSRGRPGAVWHFRFHSCNNFASLSEDQLHFSWQAQHFGDLHRRFAWQAQHFRRVALRVLWIVVSGLRQVLMCWKIVGSLAWNIHFEVHEKTHRKTSILKLYSFLARNACFEDFEAPTCLVTILWFACDVAVSRGDAAKPFIFEGSKEIVMSFCVAGVALGDMSSCFIMCPKSFCVWQAQYFCVVVRRWVAFFVAGAALWRPPSSFCVAVAAH